MLHILCTCSFFTNVFVADYVGGSKAPLREQTGHCTGSDVTTVMSPSC